MKVLILSMLLSVSSMAISQVDDTKQGKQKTLKALSDADAKALAAVLKQNDELFSKLLKADQDEVSKAAVSLIQTLKGIDSKALGVLKTKLNDLQNISKTKNKEQNLKAYGAFVPSLVEVLKTYRSDSNYQIYYCPMIKKNWIQDQRTNASVRNVFAQEMLECGAMI